MNLRKLGIVLEIISVFTTALWVVGLIMGNITIVLFAILGMVIVAPVVYIHRENLKEMFQGDTEHVTEDERTDLINDKASTMTLGIFLALIIWIGIISVTLRNSFPQFTFTGYIMFSEAAFCFVLYVVSRAYYVRKY